MVILGISAFYHDSAACLVQDGEVVAAAQEERFTRKKHDAGFPHHAVRFCLAHAGLEGGGVIDRFRDRISAPTYYETGFSVEEEAAIVEECRDVAGLYGWTLE